MSASLGTKIRLVVVDDHFFVRMGRTHALNAEPDLCVVAEADNGPILLPISAEAVPRLLT